MSRDFLADTMPRSRRGLPRLPHFDMGALLGAAAGALGGGGGGGSGSDYFEWLKKYILDEQAKQDLSEARVDEQATTQTDYRRNELADRSGYAGLVNVGSAVQETDATLAAKMQLLAPGDPQRTAYDAALESEAGKKAQAQRVITGEQYEGEDAYAALQKSIGAAGDDSDYGALQKSLEEFQGKYGWLDSKSLADDLARRRDKAKSRAAAVAGANGMDNMDYTGA